MSGLSRFPFTPSQWQELEHQALVFKYIINGMPVPPDLLFNIKRSCLDSTMSSKYLSHQAQHVGWNCFQMGIGKKIDPEPGRCRRTDGKKWRCSKEAYPDSKYCERHMHRGKNRSRKPVEVITNSNNNNNNTNTTSSTITNTNTNTHISTTTTTKTSPYSFNSTSQSLSSVFSSDTTHHYPSTAHSQYSHMGPSHSLSYHHHSSSASRPHHSPGFSSQDNSSSYLLDNHADYRYYYGVKESNEHEHEHAFFTEPSGTMRSFNSSSLDDSWQLTPLTMSTTSSSSSKQRGFSVLDSDYSYLQLQTSKRQQDHHHHNHQFYALGSEVKEQQPQKTIHRFFDDGPMDNTRDGPSSWLDLDDKSSNSSSMSTTKLSISMPSSSSNDFPIFNSRRQHNDG